MNISSHRIGSHWSPCSARDRHWQGVACDIIQLQLILHPLTDWCNDWHGHQPDRPQGAHQGRCNILGIHYHIDTLVQQAVMDPLDHKNLDLDVPYFADVVRSSFKCIFSIVTCNTMQHDGESDSVCVEQPGGVADGCTCTLSSARGTAISHYDSIHQHVQTRTSLSWSRYN